MNAPYGRTIWPDGTNTPMPEPESRSPARLKQLQDAVGGYIELVRGHVLEGEGIHVIVDEEGILKGLPFNEVGSLIANRVVLGPVLILPKGALD